MRWNATTIIAATAAASTALLTAGCMLVDPVTLFGCKDAVCRMSVEPLLLSADGNEVTVPLLCRTQEWTPSAPKGKYEFLKAIVYTVATDQWRNVPFTQAELDADHNSKDWVPQVPGEFESMRSCAADCSKFVHLKQINQPHQPYLFELFYSENGQERQLTHFNVTGDPFSWPRLSADGRTAIVRFGYEIVIIDVASGATKRIPFGDRAWNECTASGAAPAR